MSLLPSNTNVPTILSHKCSHTSCFCYTTDEDVRIETFCILLNEIAVICSNNCDFHHYYAAMNLYNINILVHIYTIIEI